MPFTRAEGAGSGGGSGESGGGGGGRASGDSGSGRAGAEGRSGAAGRSAGDAGGSAGGGSTAFEWRDDAPIRLSDGRTISAAEYRQELEDAAERRHRATYTKGYNYLLEEARRLDGLARQGSRPPAPPEDPFARLRSMPVVDGETMVGLIQAMRDQGLSPVASLVERLQQELSDTRRSLQSVTERFGSQDEDQAREDFDRSLDRDLAALEVKGLNGKIDPQAEWVRELAHDHFLSFVPSSWKKGEFLASFTKRLEAIVNGVRGMDRAHVDENRQSLRKRFADASRGVASPQGNPKFKFERGRDIAARAAAAGMFRGSET